MWALIKIAAVCGAAAGRGRSVILGARQAPVYRQPGAGRAVTTSMMMLYLAGLAHLDSVIFSWLLILHSLKHYQELAYVLIGRQKVSVFPTHFCSNFTLIEDTSFVLIVGCLGATVN